MSTQMEAAPMHEGTCTMCGDMCPMRSMKCGPGIKIRGCGFLLLHSPGSPVSARTVVAGWPLSPLSRIAIQWPHDYSLCEMVQRFTVQR